jgi:hypothetical protein
MEWLNLAQVRDKWRAVISTSVSAEGNFSASRRNVRFSVTALLTVGWFDLVWFGLVGWIVS